MCLIVLGREIHPKYMLILAANRDEFYERPTKEAHYWESPRQLLAGKDLEAGGTWMGVNKHGHVAAVTNYRDPTNYQNNKASRGQIPVNFLGAGIRAEEYIRELKKQSSKFNGFNLLALDNEKLVHYNNQHGSPGILDKGIHAVSNATLNTPWPKVVRSKNMLKSLINGNFSHDDLLAMMGDGKTANPEELPDTGIPKDLEEAVSAMCIRTEKYGTCSTTAITITYDGEVEFTEKSYPVGKRIEGVKRFSFKVDK